jgi:uncharacterized membrane protein YdbT with pleckstrin-like domain
MTNPASTNPAAPLSAPPEVVVARLRPHGRALFWPTLILFGVCALTGYLYGNLGADYLNTVLVLGAVLVAVLLWLIPLLSWLTRRYTITTRRIVFVHGIFVRTRQELLHSRGYDVSVRRTWLQSLFRSGTIRLSSGTDNRLELRDVPDAALVHQTLQELSERARAAQARLVPGLPGDPSALGDQGSFWTGR